jgi:large subunit ribosomal protein L16
MGKGKGEPDYWAARVRPGTMMFEVGGVDETIARQALVRVAAKMPVRCRFVRRRHAV